MLIMNVVRGACLAARGQRCLSGSSFTPPPNIQRITDLFFQCSQYEEQAMQAARYDKIKMVMRYTWHHIVGA